VSDDRTFDEKIPKSLDFHKPLSLPSHTRY